MAELHFCSVNGRLIRSKGRYGGTFVADGWRVDNEYDSIYWHVPTLGHGAYEFNIKGVPQDVCPGVTGTKAMSSYA